MHATTKAIAFAFAVFTLVLSAKVKLPLPGDLVPMSLQSLAVLAVSASFRDWRLGAGAVWLYLALGFMGLEVFAKEGAGPSYFLGPSGGYLVGFGLAATWAARMTSTPTGRSWPRLLAIMLGGHGIILGLGGLWLAGKIGVSEAVSRGLLPFVAGAVLKSALAAAAVAARWKRGQQRPL